MKCLEKFSLSYFKERHCFGLELLTDVKKLTKQTVVTDILRWTKLNNLAHKVGIPMERIVRWKRRQLLELK